MSEGRAVLCCPHCGAPLSGASVDAAATCRYCGVTSAPVAAAVASDGAGPTSRPCPRCGAGLFEGAAGSASLLGCGSCGGVWLDNASAHRVLATRDPATVDLAARADARARARAAARLATARCPVCAQPLSTTIEPRSGVELDLCAAHGTFFDRYELGLVVRAWGRTPAQLAPAPPAAVPDFRRVDWGMGDAAPGAIVAAGAFAIVGSLLALGSDST